MRSISIIVGVMCLSAVSTLMTSTYAAEKATPSKEQQVVDDARKTWEDFAASPVLNSELHDWMRGAKGFLIVPRILRGAAAVGVEGGRGVLVVRDGKTGDWSDPAFYTVRHLSFGLQIGGDVSQAVFVIWSQRGLEQFYTSQLKLGVDIGIAAGPMGGGQALEGLKADLFVYTRAKGAFIGSALKAGRIAVAEKSNHAYYGRPVKPTDILVEKTVSNPQAQGLRTAMAELIQ